MKEDAVFSSGRLFEIWLYTVSHRQLLIRSNKDASSSTRLEVLFKEVGFMAIPPVMKGLKITKCHVDSEHFPFSLADVSDSKPWYRLEADGMVGYVAASAVFTSEDELEYNEDSSLMSSL